MGIVINQSFKNIITTYFGFAIGAINTIFLYTKFLTDEYYGLVAFVLSSANIMMPLMAFGVHNTLIKFYSTYKTKQKLNSFLTLMLFLPLLLIIPVGLIGYFSYDTIANLLSQKNTIIGNYVWYIYVVAIAMAYFEVFFAWTKTQLKSVFGNLIKEVFHRVCIMLLLFAVYYNWITVDEFIVSIVIVYIAKMLIMMIYAFCVRYPRLIFKKIDNINDVLKYTGLIIIAGSIATLILDIDKFMLAEYIDIKEVAYYSVAVFIGAVISVPQRAMHQIMLPLTAQFLNNNNTAELKSLYKRSSLNLFIVSGFIFLLIVLNINELYVIIPEKFSGGLYVVFLISAAKLYDNILGNNNAILFNSDYYRVVLFFGVLLAVLAVILNMIFIPLYGIEGSALATFFAIFIYNTIKIVFVKKKFKMLPFTSNSLKVGLLIIICIAGFYFWDFNFHPILNIAFKSLLVLIVYGFVIVKLNISEDIKELVNRYLKK
jgi:O-antigen/teichoic acid export membrane protein